MTPIQPPDPSVVAGLGYLARTELSLRVRLGHVLLALVASAMTIVVASLWLTEPALPTRTGVAFALLTVIGLAWVAYSVWVLSARRVMLARQRVVAGRLAVAFTGAFTAGCLLLASTTAPDAAWPALVMSLALLAIALVLWRRAEAAHARLLARRETLERELTRGAR
ncbi:MAG: transmembrane transport protein [Vicinamibacterales bacterium]